MTATPARTFRPPPELWEAVKVVAAARGESVSEVITQALRRYVRRNQA